MRYIWLIANKEVRTYFASPMAYVVSAAFLAITGFFFVASVSDAFSEASIRGFLAGAVFFMIFMSPAITMRLLAEEQKIGTLELLLTSPVREVEIVIGKFLAAFITVLAMLVLSLYFVILAVRVWDTGHRADTYWLSRFSPLLRSHTCDWAVRVCPEPEPDRGTGRRSRLC